MNMKDTIEEEVGYNSVIIDKCYGPLIFTRLKITADSSSNSWIVEKEITREDSEGNFEERWVEWVRIPAGLEEINQMRNEHGK